MSRGQVSSVWVWSAHISISRCTRAEAQEQDNGYIRNRSSSESQGEIDDPRIPLTRRVGLQVEFKREPRPSAEVKNLSFACLQAAPMGRFSEMLVHLRGEQDGRVVRYIGRTIGMDKLGWEMRLLSAGNATLRIPAVLDNNSA